LSNGCLDGRLSTCHLTCQARWGPVTEPVCCLYVAEFLHVSSQQRVLKLDSDQSRNMIKYAEQNPEQRKDFIREHLAELAITNDTYLRAFNMRVATDMLRV
jgi:hypothetical protein